MKKQTKAKRSKPALWIGRPRGGWDGYEVGTRRNDWDPDTGFTYSKVEGFCQTAFERYVGKLKPGEVRRLHIRIAR